MLDGLASSAYLHSHIPLYATFSVNEWVNVIRTCKRYVFSALQDSFVSIWETSVILSSIPSRANGKRVVLSECSFYLLFRGVKQTAWSEFKIETHKEKNIQPYARSCSMLIVANIAVKIIWAGSDRVMWGVVSLHLHISAYSNGWQINYQLSETKGCDQLLCMYIQRHYQLCSPLSPPHSPIYGEVILTTTSVSLRRTLARYTGG